MDQFFCTELELVAGRYTGRTIGTPNMRAGKLEHIRQWLADSGRSDLSLKEASFYSDSINDLALLSAVGRPVVVDPDPRLESTAIRKGWAVLRLDRSR
jgi:phosphoserine phosphatase